MSHHDKFWEKFGSKARQHIPEAYSPADWAAMEQLLDGTPPLAPAKKGNTARLMALLLLLIALAYLITGDFSGNKAIPGSGQNDANLASGAIVSNLPQENRPVSTHVNIEESSVQTSKKEKSRLSIAGAGVGVGEGLSGKTLPSAAPNSAGRILAEKTLNQNQIAQAPAGPSVAAQSQNKQSSYTMASEAIVDIPSAPASETLYAAISESQEAEPAVQDRKASPIASLDVAAFLPMEKLRLVSGTFSAQEVVPAPSLKPGREWYAGLLLGVTSTATDYQDIQFSLMPLPGLFGGVRLNEKWSIQAELHAKYVNNYNLAYSVESFLYDSANNLNVIQQEFTMKAYGALEMPLVAKRRINPRLALLGGIRPSLIFEDKDGLNLSRSAREDFSTGVTPNASESNSNFSGQSIRHSDLGLILGLEWAFHPQWSLDLRYNQGTRDLSPNNLYNSSAIHLNSDLQLTLRKRLW